LKRPAKALGGEDAGQAIRAHDRQQLADDCVNNAPRIPNQQVHHERPRELADPQRRIQRKHQRPDDIQNRSIHAVEERENGIRNWKDQHRDRLKDEAKCAGHSADNPVPPSTLACVC
jgi:hypothetical protein